MIELRSADCCMCASRKLKWILDYFQQPKLLTEFGTHTHMCTTARSNFQTCLRIEREGTHSVGELAWIPKLRQPSEATPHSTTCMMRWTQDWFTRRTASRLYSKFYGALCVRDWIASQMYSYIYASRKKKRLLISNCQMIGLCSADCCMCASRKLKWIRELPYVG